MSVDYCCCKVCGESHYEEFVGNCNKCGTSLCTSCLINNDVNEKYAHRYGYKFNSENTELMKKYEDIGYELYKKDGTPYYKNGDIISDSGIDSKYCPFCSGQEIDKEKVLEYILEKYELDIDKIWKEIKEKKS